MMIIIMMLGTPALCAMSFTNLQPAPSTYRSLKKHSSEEEDSWVDGLSKHQIRGWRAGSAAGSQDKGSRKRNVFFH